MARKLNLRGLTFEKATRDFLKKRKSKLKESTLARYSFLCERHIVPYFGALELANLDNDTINNFIKYKAKNGGLRGNALSPKTIRDIVSLLVQIIKPHCNFDIDIEKPTCRQKDITIFTNTEHDRLKAYLSIGTDSKKLGVLIAMLTGIRIGELCALKWENIDLEKETITINRTIQRVQVTGSSCGKKTKVIIDTPKSSASIRDIPIISTLLGSLEKFKADGDTYILTNTKDYIEPRTYQKYFKSYLTSCNVKDNKFHTLRHTFATMAIAKGVEIKALSTMLGHMDVSFTMKRYIHPNMEHKRTQIEKLASGF